jgi:hypothetical protein
MGRGEGYLGSEIKCESQEQRQYKVLDFWVSHVEFERFRAKFAADCQRLDLAVAAAGLVERHETVGTYYEDVDGDDLVSA